jgi:hypothetical protein
MSLVFCSCAVIETSSELVGGLFASRKDRQEKQGQKLELWIGKTKAERVRVIGVPEQCAMKTSKEEVCQWRFFGAAGGTTTNSLVILTYTADLATDWSFRSDSLTGSFTRTDWLNRPSKQESQ